MPLGNEKEDIALLFPKFFKQAPHWKIAVVSGTADAAVPFLGTERWMECLNQPVLEDWKLWYMNGDVAVRPPKTHTHTHAAIEIDFVLERRLHRSL